MQQKYQLLGQMADRVCIYIYIHQIQMDQLMHNSFMKVQVTHPLWLHTSAENARGKRRVLPTLANEVTACALLVLMSSCHNGTCILATTFVASPLATTCNH